MNLDENAIVIGGAGVVGKATAQALNLTNIYDLAGSNITLKEAKDCKFIFICLPTPFENGAYNTKIIEAYIRQIDGSHIFVIRSTVYPGFGDHMAEKYNTMVVAYPEFLTEKTAVDDAKNPDIVVVGGKHKPAVEELVKVFLDKLPGMKFVFNSCAYPEFAKLAINGFYSTKVIFANMMYDYARNVGVSWDKIRDVMYERKWIGRNHLSVPYNERRGLNGRCLPKDFRALAEYSGNPFLKDLVKYSESIGGS